MKRNILFITGQFLPYTKSVGGILRVYSFLQTLKNKHNLYLLTKKGHYYGYLGLQKKNLKKIKIFYLNNNNKVLTKNLLTVVIFNFYYFFRNLFYLLTIDNSFFSINGFYKKTLGIIEVQKINYIIISSPPFSLLYLIKKIKLIYPNIKIIIDYRDSWTGRINSIFLYLIKFFLRHCLEKKIIKLADHILVATNTIKSNLLQITKKKITIIMNGFINSSKKILFNKSKKILIGYFGLVSDNYNSYRNISVLYNMLKNNKSLKKKYLFYFYGNNNITNLKIKNFSCFKFKKNILYNKVLHKMAFMDYLLVLHTEKNSSKEVITGKLYDYIGSRVPIIFISQGETEGGKIIKKNNLGFSINYLKYNLAQFFLNLKKRNYIQKRKNLYFFSRRFQNQKLLRIIK